jgi:hypothetical protein
MFASPAAAAGVTSLLFIVWDIAVSARPAAALEAGADSNMGFMKHSFQVGGAALDVNMRRAVQSLNCTRVVPALAKAGSSIRPWSSWPATSG